MHYIYPMQPKTPRTGFFNRVLRHAWTDLRPLVVEDGEGGLSHREAKLWSLILSARHVPYRMRRLPAAEGGGYVIEVQEWFADRAARELTLYFEENRPDIGSVTLPDLRPVSGFEPTLVGLGLLLLFYVMYHRVYPGLGVYPELWADIGSADGSAILSGQWWRTATALTLHADGPHVLGNAVIGGVFIWLVSRRLGGGLTWLLTILSGVLGNLANTLVLGVHHDAIGFSTATFGAAGVLAAITPFTVGGGVHGLGSGERVRRLLRFTSNALIPFGAGLGLLAMLGAGEGTDLGAHLFGFLSGAGLGVVAGKLTTGHGLPGRPLGAWMYLAALCIPLGAWWLAWLA
ncbi:rhomboid family intramembrane serine protease [Pseudodesulfovibrio portus]|uniref:Rhomboid family intramembrane serine protease n=1 Tax=Pseudodesulfovibrio portus TaxID=231439 RepID=A0ABM8AUR6_9BACT|nr:rhomboid family intramembrane serine protease [Pseudodesulfovibrio portus]BDQ35153.1 rhomboid family intramembrane serine protease [Pseudodesulfovibrio portus]